MPTPSNTQGKPLSTGAINDLLYGLLLVGLVTVVYSPAINGSFVYDDAHHITRLELQPWHGLFRIWTDLTATAQYYPITHSLFWLQSKLWGDTTAGYHLFNILLHAGTSFLFMRVLRQLDLRGAYAAGLIFALHPLCVESVAWISEQKNTLSTALYLGACLLYLDFDTTRKRTLYIVSFILFLCALLSKSVTATLPAAMLVVLWWRRGRLTWKRDALPLLPWLIVGMGSGLFTAWIERHYIGANGSSFSMGLPTRMLLASHACWFYFTKILWPIPVCFNYPRWSINCAEVAPWGLLVLLLLTALVLLRLARKHRGPLATFLLFVGSLFPVLGFFNVYPFRFSFVADHFAYLALLPLIAALVSSLYRLAHDFSIRPAFAPQIAISLLTLVLAIYSFQLSQRFQSPESLYRSTLATNPKSALAHYNLGTILAQQPGHTKDAMAAYRAAIECDPTYAEAHNNLGILLQTEHDNRGAAINEYILALRYDPASAEAHYNLGLLLNADPSQQSEAAQHFRQAIQIRPNFAWAYYQLGILYSDRSDLDNALIAFSQAVRFEPRLVEARIQLGGTLAELSRDDEALEQLNIAARAAPNIAETHYRLGVVLSRQPNHKAEAIQEYETALKLAPDFAEAHNNLGNILARAPGHLAEAIRHFERALELQPDNASARRNLETARKVWAAGNR